MQSLSSFRTLYGKVKAGEGNDILAGPSQPPNIPRFFGLPTRSLVHFVFDNFFFSMASISLIVLAIFFAVTWFTVFQDARSLNGWMFSNATGVSLFIPQLLGITNDWRCGRYRYSATASGWI